MIKHFVCMLTILMSGIGGVALRAETSPEKHSFAIYLAEGADSPHAVLRDDAWRDAKLADTPVICDADLVSYDIMLHALTITPETMARLPKPPVSGTPFVVVADGQQIYASVFATCISSQAFHVPVIMVDRRAIFPDEPANTLVIDRAYPASSAGAGADLRSDKRIITALTALGKLVSRGPSVDQTLTQQIGQILMDCHTIKLGMTREELLRVFTTEGGLSTATQRTYVHRRCPYIKIDVEFNLSEPEQNDELTNDIVKKVSPPYLQWSIND
jgi:hypothetical protein